MISFVTLDKFASTPVARFIWFFDSPTPTPRPFGPFKIAVYHNLLPLLWTFALPALFRWLISRAVHAESKTAYDATGPVMSGGFVFYVQHEFIDIAIGQTSPNVLWH